MPRYISGDRVMVDHSVVVTFVKALGDQAIVEIGGSTRVVALSSISSEE